MLTSIIQSAAAGWVWRRAQELGSLAGILVPLYLAMPAGRQEEIQMILTGRGGSLSISAGIGLAWYLWTQVQSYLATTRPQVVTTEGTKIALPKAGQDGASTTRKVEALAEGAPTPKTLAERILERITGK